MIGNDNEIEVKEAMPDYKRLYTVEEILDWEDDTRVELFEGALVMHSSPTTRHQAIQMEISGRLWLFLKDKPCKVFTNYGVRPNKDEESLFIPDIVVVCDESKLSDRVCEGAPDMVIEILSPSTARMDKKLKYNKYQQAGVKEYWIVDPECNLLEANILVNNKYTTSIYDKTDKAPVHILEDFEVDLADVFAP